MSPTTPRQRQHAYRLARELAEELHNTPHAIRARRLARMLAPAVSMTEVLNLLDAPSDNQRAELIGTTRQTVSSWRLGVTRPGPIHAKRLAELTGLPIEDIR